MKYIWPIISLTIALSFPGCSKNKDKSPLKVTNRDIEATVADITAGEVEEFVGKFQEAFRTKNEQRYLDLYDRDTMFNRIFPKDVVDSNRLLERAKTGWMSGVARPLSTMLNRADSVPDFLRMVRDTEGVKLRFRFLMDGGLNYLDMLLDRDAEGKVKIVDYLDYISGETLSGSQRQLLQQAIPGLLEGTATKDEARRKIREMTQMKNMAELFYKKQFKLCLNAYDRLPQILKQQKSIMNMRLLAANGLAVELLEKDQDAEDVYTKAVDDYRGAHPKAANLELMLIDYYFFKEEFQKVLEVVDKLDQRVGGDPYLNLYRANSHFMRDEPGKAKKYHDKMIKNFPGMADSYYVLVEISLEEKNYQEITRLLIAMEKNTEVEWDENFNGEEMFDGYRASPEFAKWKAYLRSK